MHFAFTEEQEELREMARGFLTDHSDSERVRRAMESELGWDPVLWKRISEELGWPSVIVPEAYGGIGLTEVELVALLEVMGEHLLCAPFFSTIALGANALLVAGTEAQKQAHLPGIAEGHSLVTLALTGPGGPFDSSGIACTARRDGADTILDGRVRYVLDGHAADHFVVAARAQDGSGDDAVELHLVPGDSAGLGRLPLPTMDQTRRQAEIAFEGVRVPESGRMAVAGSAAGALREILDRAAIALAAEQAGGARRCLEISVAYAKEREQFGRPIGSFQAIKHKCADMMLLVESARSAAYYAGCVAAEGSSELPRAASLAKAYCSEAFYRCAAESIQIFGGVGFTWEYDAHLYFKRARSMASYLGDAGWHRERIARELELQP